MVRADHDDLEAGGFDRPALVHPDHALVAGRQATRQPETELMDAWPDRLEPALDREGVAEVIEMPMAHEQQIAAIDLVGLDRTVRVLEERIEHDRATAGGV